MPQNLADKAHGGRAILDNIKRIIGIFNQPRRIAARYDRNSPNLDASQHLTALSL